jgi:radical SAM protein with 4Fe4S-binding SPASM domain
MKREFNLREIKLEVTYRCPLTCIHCSSDATPSSTLEMMPKDCLRIIGEALEMHVDKIAFSGGEPLIWDCLDDAVHLASSGGMQVSLYTSGNIPKAAEKIKKLARSGAQTCIFSLFGATAEVHEQVTRSKGSYQGTRSAIAVANECGLGVEVHFVPLSSNFEEFGKIAEIAKDSGVSRISVLRLVPQGRGSLIRSYLLNRMQNLRLKRIVERLRSQGFDIRTGSPYNFLMLNDQPECSSGIDRLIVGPDLRIYPCDAFKQVKAEEIVGTLEFSTLENNHLQACWDKSPFLEGVRCHLTTPPSEPCKSCRAFGKCLSGCLAQKVIEYGDLQKRPDPMCLMN